MKPSAKTSVEAILFSSDDAGMERSRLSRLAELTPDETDAALVELADDYAGRSLMLVAKGTRVAVRTRPEFSDFARAIHPPARKFSNAALETLAAIALYGPVTRGDVERIRGVRLSSSTLEQIVDEGLVAPGPRRETPGRPMTWLVTTRYNDLFSVHEDELSELRSPGGSAA
jgi:segregation and condensation protein B